MPAAAEPHLDRARRLAGLALDLALPSRRIGYGSTIEANGLARAAHEPCWSTTC
jgi:hypothetical protein